MITSLSFADGDILVLLAAYVAGTFLTRRVLVG